MTSKSDATVPSRKVRSLTDYVGLVFRGFAMGAADVVPGVSGGTMAFILGIYEELIESIRTVGEPRFLKAVVGFKIKEIFQILNWPFLVAVVSGILLAILTLAQGMEWALHNHRVYLWSFFFGLVLASVFIMGKRVGLWTVDRWIVLIIGAGIAFAVVGSVPHQTPETWWFLFLSGALAICAMILPGISGAFILVLLGKYQYILGAVNDRDFVTIAIVGAGAVLGLVSFAQVLGWLFKRYHDLTVAVLIGFMLGSLRKIWPWKEVVATITDRHGDLIPTVEHNILPALTVNGGVNSQILIALGLAVLGLVVVILLDRWANQAK